MTRRRPLSLRQTWSRYQLERHALRAIAVLFPLAWLFPVSGWPSLCTRINRLLGARKSRYTKKVADVVAVALEEDDPGRALDVAHRILSGRLEYYMYCFRHYRPGPAPVAARVEGLHHVADARRDGRPIIMWAPPQLFASLLLKQAFHDQGLALHHVSANIHGFLARSRFGRRHLNPVITRIEDRFLAERIWYQPNDLIKVSLRIDRILRDGGILSVTAGAGPRSEMTGSLLDGRHAIRLAIGPIKLAWRHEAVILPCYLERVPDGTFIAHITEPLDVAASDDPSECVAMAMREYADRVSSVIMAQPSLWPFGADELE